MAEIQTRIQGFAIKHAEPEDVPVILALIRELAIYEKLLHEVVATEQSIHEALFGERKSAEAVVGKYNGNAVGFALFFHNFSTFLGKRGLYLEDLYVKPEMRSRGFGGVMLAYLAKIAVDRDCGRMEWSVLDWNEPAIGFYESIGAVPMSEWTVNRLTGEALRKQAEKF